VQALSDEDSAEAGTAPAAVEEAGNGPGEDGDALSSRPRRRGRRGGRRRSRAKASADADAPE
jgi:ribonuclease G